MDTRVLVVEDDAEINELLGEYLSLENIKYLQALDGKSAIQAVRAERPDAIILDLMLPDIDGYQVASEVVSHRGTYNIPIIMLTCMNQAQDREKGIANGAYRFMNKPFLPDDLLANIRRALEWKKSLDIRPSGGRVEISPDNACGYHQSINEMIRDLFTRTKLSDRTIGQIRTGFQHLMDWATEWDKQHQKESHIIVEYRITDADGQLSSNGQAAAIHWQIWEPNPGLLEEMLFKPAALAVSLSASSAIQDMPVSPLANWYQFMAQCGVNRFDKDSKGARVRLERALVDTSATTVPLVVINGVRTPTRLRQEINPQV